MKVLVINGVNLNMLGKREPDLYGNETLKQIEKEIKQKAKALHIKAKCVFSNYEGKIVWFIQQALGKYDGIIINAGAYTHTSIAILDALKSVNIPTVEVHLTDITKREDFRKKSFISSIAKKTIMGKGKNGYFEALEFFSEK